MNVIFRGIFLMYIMAWDTGLVIMNLIVPKRKVGKVTPKGCAGFEGKWPEYVPKKEGDSRCSCPALNAMANHGILPHDGKNIKFTEMTQKIRETYNFAPSFCSYVPHYSANYLKRSYAKDTFDLHELDLHNAIEHDGSLVREDKHFVPDQSVIAVTLIEDLLSRATGKDKDGNVVITKMDLAGALSQRLSDSMAHNPEYTMSMDHKTFAAANASTMLTIFGGQVEALRIMLLEERIPEGWESQIRQEYGLTLGAFNGTVFPVITHIKDVPPTAKKTDEVPV